jgi:signal peptidase II
MMMNNNRWRFSSYIVLFFLIFALDRITKYAAFYYLDAPWLVNQYLSFMCVLNRGIVWGILNSAHSAIFIALSSFVVGMYAVLLSFTIYRWRQHKAIFAEICMMAGGISNILDRCLYHGVIDFIVLSYKSWVWPIFNCADVAIAFGVLILGITCLYE